MKNFLFILTTCICLAACKKHHNQPKADNPYGLPNATQIGKNTLGFLLNGKPWTPQGFNGTANLSLYYDETFQNGVFNLSAYKILNTQGQRQKINLYGDFVQGTGNIVLPNPTKFGVVFKDDVSGCDYYESDSSTQITNGYFNIKKLDKVNKIFSAEFEFTITKKGCPDIQITYGRFDMHY